MKRTIKILALIIAVLLLTTQAQAKDEKRKIGYVDLYKVFSECSQTKKSEEILEKKAQEKNKERDKLAEEIKKLREEAELLSRKEKEKKKEAIEDKLKELRDFDRATREELNRERDSMGRDVLIEIGKSVSAYGKKHNFDLILDSRNLFYSSESLDVSDKIIKEINKKK